MIAKASEIGFRVDLNMLNRKGVPRHINILEAGGFIFQYAAGLYGFTPFGTEVIGNMADQVRQKLKSLGHQEIVLPMVQPVGLWSKSGRDEKFDRTLGRIGDKFILSPTHDELVYEMSTKCLANRKLPVSLFHVGHCFRQEIRPKNGLLRGAEFMLIDGYVFSENAGQSEAQKVAVTKALLELFTAFDLSASLVKFLANDRPGMWSEEFAVESQAIGEQRIGQCPACSGKYRYPQNSHCECGELLTVKKGIEFADVIAGDEKQMSLFGVKASGDGKSLKPVHFSYGIGLTKLLGTVIEVSQPEFCWPDKLAPFSCSVVQTKTNGAAVSEITAKLQSLSEMILLDDRDIPVSKKIQELSGFGIAKILIPKPDGTFEMIDRRIGQTKIINQDEMLKQCAYGYR